MTRHPPGLYVLFFTEMWERFSYYGMRSLLVLYMVHGLHYDIIKASAWYGLYTGMVYFTPALGGLITDRYLGQDRAIVLGGALMALGHFAMVVATVPFFVLALTLIVLGCGLFKPSVSVQVGDLYEPNDPRRDGAFSFFYMGINLGGFLAPLICGTLGQKFGWHYGFGCAGIGMVVALLVYGWGRKHLAPLGAPHGPMLGAASESQMAGRQWRHIGALFILSIFGNVAFWATFEQAGTSLTLFAEQSVDLWIGSTGVTMPSSWFQMANPLFIMVLAPAFSALWLKLNARGQEPSTPMKFVLGLALVGGGFAVMAHAGALADGGHRIGPGWLILTYFLNTCGELCVSPVGLAAVTRLAPKAWVSLLMGMWLASQALANLLGGALAGEYALMPHGAFFMAPMALAGVSALMLLMLVRPLRKMMHGVG
jgi:POT family proton-dependent oligopeptide transporter